MSLFANHVAYRYNPNRQTEQGITNDWIVDRHNYDTFLSREPDVSASSMNPMRRYIGESESALFNAPTQPDTATLPSFHSLDLAPHACTSIGWPYSLGPELPSPTLSGPTSSYYSSAASDRQSTPLSPPDSAFATWSPEIVHADHYGFAFGGGHGPSSEPKHSVGYPCVALHDVQSYEDMQLDNLAYDDDTAFYGSYASATHEGYQPVEPASEIADSGVETEQDSKEDDDYTPHSPNLRRRRPQGTRAVTSPRAPSKITKRSGHTRRSSAPQPRKTSSGYSSVSAGPSNRAFACALAPYGCDSTFGSKNEWKRHVNTQHMRLYYWRCDQCDNNKKPNDFNRKDLFIQHVRRMHPVETISTSTKKTTKQSGKPIKGTSEDHALSVLAERCFKQDRSPPTESGCHFCEATFEDIDDASQAPWDKRLEHIAHHMENGKKDQAGPANPASWQVDARLEPWLVKNGIVVGTVGGGYVLA